MNKATTTTTIGSYIVNRLKEVGIDTIFGVPGDCTLTFLDIIEDDPDMAWGNNANELNAAYAADGYARIKGIGALCTTMGVGELSAINGIGGSFAEFVPVIQIVGYCSTDAQKRGALVHHSLGNGDYDTYFNISSQLTVAAAKLTKENALSEIDRVIETAYRKKRPGYIHIPVDLVDTVVDLPHDFSPLQLASINPFNNRQLAIQNSALSSIIKCINKAKNPIIIVDFHVLRLQMEEPVNQFVQMTGIPTFCTPMGKSAVYSHLPNYGGIFYGKCSSSEMQAFYESADLIIEFGSFHSNLNTGIFTVQYDQEKILSLNFDSVFVQYTQYSYVGLQEMVPLLNEAVKQDRINIRPHSLFTNLAALPKIQPSDALPEIKSLAVTRKRSIDQRIESEFSNIITQSFFWDTLPQFMVENSTVIAEVGTCMHGALNVNFPGGHTKYIQQGLWMSIGYTVPATLGACMADRSKTVYLLVGDGSFQLTAQEISVLIRQGVTPVIILLNNDGYLIEKLLHGPHRSYNNFQMWNYSKSLDYFGGHLEINKEGVGKNPSTIGVEARVETCQEFITTMKRVRQEPNKIHFVEVILSQFDSPQALTTFADTYRSKLPKK